MRQGADKSRLLYHLRLWTSILEVRFLLALRLAAGGGPSQLPRCEDERVTKT
jgi:hypothetical protein